jgi:hypothetical protein
MPLTFGNATTPRGSSFPAKTNDGHGHSHQYTSQYAEGVSTRVDDNNVHYEYGQINGRDVYIFPNRNPPVILYGDDGTVAAQYVNVVVEVLNSSLQSRNVINRMEDVPSYFTVRKYLQHYLWGDDKYKNTYVVGDISNPNYVDKNGNPVTLETPISEIMTPPDPKYVNSKYKANIIVRQQNGGQKYYNKSKKTYKKTNKYKKSKKTKKSRRHRRK